MLGKVDAIAHHSLVPAVVTIAGVSASSSSYHVVQGGAPEGSDSGSRRSLNRERSG
jgi:hypothetical protein